MLHPDGVLSMLAPPMCWRASSPTCLCAGAPPLLHVCAQVRLLSSTPLCAGAPPLLHVCAQVRLLLLAVMAGEHLLLLGPPGTAKSALGRRLSALMSGVYFERLLTRFSVPEELFGPLSMRALEQDQYVRQVQGFLPAADVAFLDEVFKGNSAILNTLLTIVNEGLFDNGSQRIKVSPVQCAGQGDTPRCRAW